MRSILVALLLAGSLAWSASGAALAVSGQNHIHSIVVMPKNPNELYVGGHYYLYHSNDGGRHWTRLVPLMMLSLAMDPSHTSNLYAFSAQKGLLKSTDGGRHWSFIGHGVPAHGVVGVRLDPSSGDLLAYGLGIYRSTDGGKKWSRVVKGNSVYDIATSSGHIDYAATGSGLFVSRDSGAHWSAVSALAGQPIIQVAAAGHSGYAVSPLGILVSSNDGRSWTMRSKAPQGIEYLAVAPDKPAEIFGYVGNKGFFVSENAGKTWHSANTGIHDRNFSASPIVVSPSNPGVAYTGSWGIHFYATRDAGHAWKQVATIIK